MSFWSRSYRIAGLRLEIESEVGDPTPFLPAAMSGFALDAGRDCDALRGRNRHGIREEGGSGAYPCSPCEAGPGAASATPGFTATLYDDEEAHTDPLRRFFPPRFALVPGAEGYVFAAVQGRPDGERGGEGWWARERLKPLGVVEEGGSGRLGMPPLERAWKIPEEEEAVREALQGFVKACLQMVLLRYGGTMVHAAGVAFGGEGFLLAGHTRAGKTTLSRQFPREAVLGDDLVAIREEGGIFALYGTPWPGREGGAVSYGGLPLRAALMLHPELPRGLRRRRPGEALAELSANAPRLGYPGEESKLLDIFSRLVEEVPIYELSLGLGDDAVPFIEQVSAREGHEEEDEGEGPAGE